MLPLRIFFIVKKVKRYIENRIENVIKTQVFTKGTKVEATCQMPVIHRIANKWYANEKCLRRPTFAS